jgi:argininosuccinate lyase
MGRALGIRLETLSPLMRDLKIKVERMRELAGANWAQATDLAAALVREKGIDWRNSHQIVSVFVRRNIAAGIRPDKATSASLDDAAAELGIATPRLSADIFSDAMDPAAFVRRRKLLGGPAPEAISREVETARGKVDADERLRDALEKQIERAHEALETAISAFIAD